MRGEGGGEAVEKKIEGKLNVASSFLIVRFFANS